MPISVLVVDDSALIRSLLKEIIQADLSCAWSAARRTPSSPAT